MNSVLTNTGAMTALQVLNSVNKGLGETQGRISTGLKVATADQNAAIFAVAGVMKADVAGYETISEGLGLAESAVSVARSAAENISDLLKEMKTKVVQSKDGNVDRTKIQADIDELVGQISTIADAASFNGINYLKGQEGVDVLSSLNRSTTDGANYDVAVANISFTKQNLVFGEAAPSDVTISEAGQTQAAAMSSVVDLDITLDPTLASNGKLSLKIGGVANTTAIDLSAAATATLADTATKMQTQLQTDFGAGVTVSVTSDNKIRITDANGRGITNVAEATAGAGQFNLNSTSVIADGSTARDAIKTDLSFTFDNLKTGGSTTYAAGLISTVTYTDARGQGRTIDVSAAGSMTAVATALQTALRADPDGTPATGTNRGANTDFDVTWDAAAGKLNVVDRAGYGAALRFEGEGSGKLGGLATIDVTTDAGSAAALGDIETWIQDALDSASALGSTQKRLSIQRDFLGKLTDSLKTGIGTLVDADMTAESARLQSLQVQQQLATQALSIANQQPQSLLSLFR